MASTHVAIGEMIRTHKSFHTQAGFHTSTIASLWLKEGENVYVYRSRNGHVNPHGRVWICA